MILPYFLVCCSVWVIHDLFHIYSVMEYCAGGDLSQLIADRKEKRIKGTYNALLEQSFIVKVFYQLLQALKELHYNDQV